MIRLITLEQHVLDLGFVTIYMIPSHLHAILNNVAFDVRDGFLALKLDFCV